MNTAISGYSNEKCHSYDFFVKHYGNAFVRYPPKKLEDASDDIADDVESVEGDIEEKQDAIAESNEECLEDDYGEDSDSEEDSDIEGDKGEILEDGATEGNKSMEGTDNEDENEGDESEENECKDKTSKFPTWFLEKLYPAHLPRYFVDLVHLRKYINSPQIEHFPYNDCNEIALPILRYIFTLLNSAEGEETQPALDENGEPLPIQFTYLGRRPRVTNIHYTRYATQSETKFEFTPAQPEPLLLRNVFKDKMPHLDSAKLFERVEHLPKGLQMYFLAIVYWLHKSQNCDLIHLHALIICVVVLHTIDTKIPAERDTREFQKRFGKIIKNERIVRETEALKGNPRTIKEHLLVLSVPERMDFIPKSDCYLVMDNLLKHFHMQEIFKKKYDTYSTIVLHAFSEFQSIVYQLYGLNGLLDMPYAQAKMGQLFCGVFIYNIYDLLKTRVDITYYIQNFIFRDSQMMFDFYNYLWQWCDEFVPHWKRPATQTATAVVNRKVSKKKRQAARKCAAAYENADPNADIVDRSGSEGVPEEIFEDLNNKFSTFLTMR